MQSTQWPAIPGTKWPDIPVEVVERDYKVYREIKSHPDESRKFYEIIPHIHYIFILRLNGQVFKIFHAQNILVFLFQCL